MTVTRRTFLHRAAVGGGLLLLPGLLRSEVASRTPRLTILHTNDWHSRIDPFPDDGGRNANQGGAVRRANLIAQVRNAEPNVLLFDSGDIFQGTPYFNFFQGELEMKLMSQMGYDAGTIGNHDFDGGIDNLATQLQHATFPLLSANYDFNGTPLQDRIAPYRVFVKQGIRVGVFGLGIELDGLVPKSLYGATAYQDPIERGNDTARHLRTRQKCDLVVCLSHLGYRYTGSKVDDVKLAAASRGIDLILGGHTHTFLDAAVTVPNELGEPVIINQVGFGGLRLGRLDITFPGGGARRCVACSNLRV
ncbi:Trifunctional nucleotide phosphoesterase protein YfkN [Neolewinella maritima]|uniref:Trifunctional nucleotide phosphoesterase protein YfkN n=1 Tax=Neolewinella maritima TaxID=1383882 RepID=A0ABM9AZM9_9BACT|nr:metallophosphatase [Neolewinella maritima]CAH1000251.1 Trifunctional nucleotide phosphoesterase protein YfkN [Neolewinella maritima]